MQGVRSLMPEGALSNWLSRIKAEVYRGATIGQRRKEGMPMSHIVVLGAGLGGTDPCGRHLERRVPGRFRRRGHRLRRAAADPAARRQPVLAGQVVHTVKVGFEKYFLHKVRQGKAEIFYENLTLDLLGIRKLKDIHLEPTE